MCKCSSPSLYEVVRLGIMVELVISCVLSLIPANVVVCCRIPMTFLVDNIAVVEVGFV